MTTLSINNRRGTMNIGDIIDISVGNGGRGTTTRYNDGKGEIVSIETAKNGNSDVVTVKVLTLERITNPSKKDSQMQYFNMLSIGTNLSTRIY